MAKSKRTKRTKADGTRDYRIQHRDYQHFLAKVILVVLLLLIQFAIIGLVTIKYYKYLMYVQGILRTVSLCVVLYLINKQDNPAYKLAWVIPILLFPVGGGLAYVLLAGNRTRRRFVKKTLETYHDSIQYMPQDEQVLTDIRLHSKGAYAQSRYISDIAGYPVYTNTEVAYYPIGEEFYEALIEQLEQAEHYIFMEYFIIQDGQFWGSVRDILVKKAKAGVDVRLIFDDMGCVATLPPNYVEVLESMGIKCESFNRFIPIISLGHNNRDHRKITVIDGYIGFTGGINLADEYINKHSNYGHWKDTGVMLKGEAVWNFTVMFLQTWNYLSKTMDEYYEYEPHDYYAEQFKADGYIQPYGDTPMDQEIVGENIYLNMINRAKYSVWIMTPYLIIDHEMQTALCLASKSGIDVRIITPGIPDKKVVYIMTQSQYQPLIEAGVKIYQYTPGFVHAKNVMVDGEIATVGSVNFDFRSLYLHFECGVWMYRCSAIAKMEEDFLATQEMSEQVTLEQCHRVGFFVRLLRSVLRLFAPLM